MKKIVIIALTFILAAGNSFAQIKKGSTWMNGTAFFIAEDVGQEILFRGGTCHEGGWDFILKTTQTDGVYTLASAYEGFDFATIGKVGDTVKYVRDNYNAWTFLEVIHNGLISDILFRTEDESLFDFIITNEMATMNGEYVDEKGKKYMFDYSECILGSFVPQKTRFNFGTEYDSPANVLLVGDKIFMYEITLKGMKLYMATYDKESDLYEKGQLAANLTFVDKGEGRFPWTSKLLINGAMVRPYSKEALRIMRNEILARKGYRFNSADLKAHFGSKSWYSPVEDNSKINLSLGEQIAIEIIKSEENLPDSERY